MVSVTPPQRSTEVIRLEHRYEALRSWAKVCNGLAMGMGLSSAASILLRTYNDIARGVAIAALALFVLYIGLSEWSWRVSSKTYRIRKADNLRRARESMSDEDYAKFVQWSASLDDAILRKTDMFWKKKENAE